MDVQELHALFQRHHEELLDWDRAEKRYSPRRDLNGLLLIAKLAPGEEPLLSWWSHCDAWLSVAPEDVAKTATEAEVVELLRSGIMLHPEGFYFGRP